MVLVAAFVVFSPPRLVVVDCCLPRSLDVIGSAARPVNEVVGPLSTPFSGKFEMYRSSVWLGLIATLVVGSFAWENTVLSHDVSLHKHRQTRRLARAKARALTAAGKGRLSSQTEKQEKCQLTIELIDSQTREPLFGLVRLSNSATGDHLALTDAIDRDMNWYVADPSVPLVMPAVSLQIEALHGIEYARAVRSMDLRGVSKAKVSIPLKRIYDPRADNWRSGNTHLHLMKMTHAEAVRYLRTVPRADGLDLVFVSHLRRLPDERHYITNEIVENSFQGGALKRLSQGPTRFGNGQEHRHNFGAYGEGYGHVMLLDLRKLIRPVSIGPGIMNGEGSDGIPLQRGIRLARKDGATAIWCHNTYGFEDVANWVSGELHAQNIFDGSPQGSYQDSFYRYLNLGMKVPFSTGTDWFLYDFSRVYVPLTGELTAESWLSKLRAGKSYITNGTFLEFEVDGKSLGDTIALSGPRTLEVQGRAVGRNDFQGLQVIHNGRQIHQTKTRSQEGHFSAECRFTLSVEGSGWLALRIPLEAGKNELDKPLFAHTSPVYLQVDGKPVFRPEVARDLIQEMKDNLKTIRSKGKFDTAEEMNAVLRVHQDAIENLQSQLQGR